MTQDHPLFEIVTTTAGAVSIRNKKLNEIMHNPVGPWKEAHSLYIHPSRLVERLRAGALEEELVIYDVGLGAAANSLAALHCHQSITGAKRPLRIVSFERETSLLRFALDHAGSFDHFRGFERAMENLLADGTWQAEGMTWELREGDFLDRIGKEAHGADLVFFDPYSMTVNPEMWTVECFRQIRAKCREESEEGALLLNYSRATPFRTALFLAGFYVGQGPETGLKPETTQASTKLRGLSMPLGGKWLDRWKRSHAKMPPELPSSEWGAIEDFILGHEQFRTHPND